jgi:formylglycine-generating enzyme required for sulfatase activity
MNPMTYFKWLAVLTAAALLAACNAPITAPPATQEPLVVTATELPATPEPEIVVVTATGAPTEVIAATEAPPAATQAPAEATVPPPTAAGAGELGMPGNPVVGNQQWIPVIERDQGIGWALVPAGCFTMGWRNGFTEETPENEQCFDEPFWIASTETTNEQYGSDGAFSGEDFPRTNVTWQSASAFCQAKGGRLPTEAEWEYAARGPSNLMFPFGDQLQPGFVIHADSGGVAVVGSQTDNASWVGALDMAGNVREWVSSGWEDYPFDPTDGRESPPPTGETRRVVRGGGFTTGRDFLRSSYREFYDWEGQVGDIGFRCARDWQP